MYSETNIVQFVKQWEALGTIHFITVSLKKMIGQLLPAICTRNSFREFSVRNPSPWMPSYRCSTASYRRQIAGKRITEHYEPDLCRDLLAAGCSVGHEGRPNLGAVAQSGPP